MVVRWRTDLPTDSRVQYGTNPNNLDSTVPHIGITTEHEVRLTGLSADTRYYYSVGDGLSVLSSGPDHFFLTAPNAAKPTRIWVLGDSGTANDDAARVRDAYESFTGARHTDIWMMLGDNAYWSGMDIEYQYAVFEMYPAMLRKSVLWPTIGNHETYSFEEPMPYLSMFTLPTGGEAGGVPSGTERYYSFNYGNIHFVCLDSMTEDRSSFGPMASWLQQDLTANTNTWLIAFWHHPPYTKGSHNSDDPFGFDYELVEMRQNILPILESFGVDLVLSGHSHSYERSFLINAHYGFSQELETNPHLIRDSGSGRPEETGPYVKIAGISTNQGAIYIVAGSSGMISGGPLNHPAMFISLNRLGSLVLDIDGDRLDAQFLEDTGDVTDYFTFLKGASFRILSLRLEGSSLRVAWQSEPAKRYRVEHKVSLADEAWIPVSGEIVAPGLESTWDGPLPPGPDSGFYRVVRLFDQ